MRDYREEFILAMKIVWHAINEEGTCFGYADEIDQLLVEARKVAPQDFLEEQYPSDPEVKRIIHNDLMPKME